MQSTNFVVLTGHLNDYPLSDLISILRHQGKTGRLTVEYPVGPCAFYFAEGDLVDAQLGTLGGLQAIIVSLSQPNASFNFNPLIQPPRRSINESSQKVILELLGCWEEKTVDIEQPLAIKEPPNGILAPQASLELIDSGGDVALLPAAKEMLALPPAPASVAGGPRIRQIVITSAVISLLVSLLTVVALTSWFNKRAEPASSPELARSSGMIGNESERAQSNAQTVKVIVRIEGGRVTRAFVAEHRAGAEAYEALALKIARGRRYQGEASGEDTVLVRINSPTTMMRGQ
jgi:hypothetical protein